MRVEAARGRVTRRAGLGCGIPVVTALGVFFVVSLLSLGLFFLSPARTEVAASFIHAQPGSISWDGHDRLNVLLLGTAQHASPSAQMDAIMVASFDPGARTIRTLSIPPDLWVTVPGYGPARIADAYGDGGAPLTVRVVENLTRVPIPYYAVVDFSTVEQIVDSLGGLPWTGRSGAASSPSATGSPVRRHSSPEQRLTGAAVVQLLRSGAPGPPGDMQRMRREQQVLFGLRSFALQSGNFFRIPSLINAVGGSISSNFPYNQVPQLARALISVPRSRMSGGLLGFANGAVMNYDASGEGVLLPDTERIRVLAHQLFADAELRSAGGVDVWNGSGVDGQAAGLASWLQGSGLHVAAYTSAPRPYRRTQVIVRAGVTAATRDAARTIATLLQAPLVTGAIEQGGAPIVVIIGHDFQDPSQE